MGRQGPLGVDDRRDNAERAVRGMRGGGAADYGAGAGDEGAGVGAGGVGAGDGDGGGGGWERAVREAGEEGERGLGGWLGVRYLCSELGCI